MASAIKSLRQSFKGKKKRKREEQQNRRNIFDDVESPPVLLQVKYDHIKSTLEVLSGTITVITKKAKKSKRKNDINSHLDFRDEFNKLQEDVENVKKCFHCDDDEDKRDDTYGFNRHKGTPTQTQTNSAEVTVHEPLADYTRDRNEDRYDSRKQFKRSRSVDLTRRRKTQGREEEFREENHRLSEELQRCKADLKKYKCNLQKEIKAREDAQTRLSEMMGKQLKTNNPAITDLSDPGRPLSLVEKLSNIYDNEWTDAIEDVEKITRDEPLASKILLSVITDSYQECFSLRYKGTAYIGFENDRKTYSIKHKIRDVPDEFGPQLKKLDGKELDKLRQAVLRRQDTQVKREISSCLSNKKQYIHKCVELCWMMVCHSPPVHLEWNYEGKTFDHHLLKPFTEDGTVIQFMVWPVMFLHKDGPLLCKGVAQGCSGKQQTQF